MLLRPRNISVLAAALMAIGGISGITHSAAAGYPVKMTVDGPSILTSASKFTVTLDGDSTENADVCRVQETATRQSAAAAPYDLPVTLSSLPAGPTTLVFQAVACDNTLLGQVKQEIDVPVHVTNSRAYVAPLAQDTSLRQYKLSVVGDEGPLSATITRGNSTVATLATKDGTSGGWTWAPGSAPTGTYTAEVTTGSGATVAIPFSVTAGWAPLNPPFPRCQTLTWSYSARNQPAKASGMVTDISTAFSRISSATGIKFRKVPSKGTITLEWANLGTGGPDGEGGSTWSGDTAVSGKVQFNVKSTWVAKKGFHRYQGFPGRGALITHEIGHTLGLGHVTDRHQVMYPIASNGSPLGLASGDRAGLVALYHAKTC